MQLSFEDRTYLVTGGGSGIGKGVAAGLVAAGAAVVIVGRNADRLAATAEAIESSADPRCHQVRAGRRHRRGPDRTGGGGRHRVARPAARGGALRGRLGDHRPGHPDRLAGLAAHRRPQCQRHHVRAQARRPRNGARRRRFVRGHLLDRREQHPPLVRRLRGQQIGGGPHDEAGRRRAGPVLGAGQQYPPGSHPHRTRCARYRLHRS